MPIAGDQPSPASASALTSRRDGCDFFAKNAPSSIAALSTGICSRASSALMPSGRSCGLEDEVEQHRDHLDRHRFELVRLLAERRLLQVAQDVVRALAESPRTATTCAPPRSKSVSPACSRVRPFAAGRRGDDRRARDVARRRRRAAGRETYACAAPGMPICREVAAAAVERIISSAAMACRTATRSRGVGGRAGVTARHMRSWNSAITSTSAGRLVAVFGSACRGSPRPRSGRARAAADAALTRCAAGGHHVEARQVLVEVRVDAGDLAQRAPGSAPSGS